MTTLLLSTAAADRPAGGVAIGQMIIATVFATFKTVGHLGLQKSHLHGSNTLLQAAGGFAERASGLPPWAGLPAGVGGATLLVALLGMYWDISLHIDNGRDPGPLANPAHYLI